MLVAKLRYGLDLSISWPLLISSALLVTVMATAVGYAIGVSMKPMVAQLSSQVLVFFRDALLPHHVPRRPTAAVVPDSA